MRVACTEIMIPVIATYLHMYPVTRQVLVCSYLSYSFFFSSNVLFYSLGLVHKECAAISALPADAFIPLSLAVSGSALSPW